MKTKAACEKGSLSNTEFSAIIFYIMRKESLTDRDAKKTLSYGKFHKNLRNYVKLQEAVDLGVVKLTDRWKEAEVFLGLKDTEQEQEEQEQEE